MKRIPLLLVILLICAACHAQGWQKGRIVPADEVKRVGARNYFAIEPISDALMARMQRGGSYPPGCPVKRADLRYLKVLHCDYTGATVCGEMVCNKAIAQDLLDIFLQLYLAHYQIERMQLIDDYGANDEESMRHNNTSGFCYRTVSGTRTLSKHAQGLAVDINTQHNPCVKRDAAGRITRLQPNTAIARQYATRTPLKPHMIQQGDLCHRLFLQHGFRWGGSWRTTKDYQHFEK